MTRLALLVSVTLVLGAATSARAQELNLATTSTARPSIVEVRTGVEHAFLGEVGYRHVLDLGHQQLFVGGDVSLPWAKVDLDDYRVRATVGLPFGWQHWKLAGWLSPTLRGTVNAVGEMTAIGADLRLTGGYYARGWFVVAEAGFDWVAATKVTFSYAYRNQVYSAARDGWYRTPGGTTYAGLHGGVSFSSFDLVLRAGNARTTALEQQTMPFYLTVGVNVTL
ncbi:MAG TPA: hypothetical protein VFF02_06380 [Anaeromyxobacteraceae bacterium]|nr:hypothetical protein [Anaeromyxobacteraceae bacterium]